VDEVFGEVDTYDAAGRADGLAGGESGGTGTA